ncbi:BA75_02004T0 [Komagataella pastoris]|uniref:BA75_02004T0 n=1 Tax=Komagataella pastoris TaxID=4922 RepID=A0A1B2JDW4_PICPA|nr:BA75_02004T0 [Komagataella pastoris]
MEELIETIGVSVDTTEKAVKEMLGSLDNEIPEIIKAVKGDGSDVEGVSLLDLKNSAIASYVNSLILIILSNIERMKLNGEDEEFNSQRESIVKNSIVQRVTLDKGVKGLEKRLQYQIEKMVRAYSRMEQDEKDLKEKQTQHLDEDGETKEEVDDAEEEEEEEEGMSYRPNPSAMLEKLKSNTAKPSSSGSSDKYRPPRIAAVAPPSSEAKQERSKTKHKKLQSMEEYLQETNEAPMLTESVGSNIMGQGRGGVKTSRERDREEEIREYEETNFTRLPTSVTEKSKKQKRSHRLNTFAGEDWSFFGKDRDEDMKKSARKNKSTAPSAWEKAKRRRGN